MVWPGAMERYLSVGETIAAWKSIECIIGEVAKLAAGICSSERLVIENFTLSPTRTRTIGPGTWSPKVHAVYFTPGARSITLCVTSIWISFTGFASSGFTAASSERALPLEKLPVWRAVVIAAGGGFRSMRPTS